ncbi:hypothetical protein BTIS_0192 [Bifidobacterium tissieri]|uniref:Uncharacterized protein n=1 Tax=Bifidobacterium tissieri TaxID=1630162 RepID=A0A261FIT6_9BIFI|nr:hypothetical protein BTIS_0192 [Bifidobacterium tissieri]
MRNGQPGGGRPDGRQPSGRQPSGTERTNSRSAHSLPRAVARNGETSTRVIPCHGSRQRMTRSPKSTLPATISCHTMTSRAFCAFPATIVRQGTYETGSSDVPCHGRHPVITPRTEKTTEFTPYSLDLRANRTEFRGRKRRKTSYRHSLPRPLAGNDSNRPYLVACHHNHWNLPSRIHPQKPPPRSATRHLPQPITLPEPESHLPYSQTTSRRHHNQWQPKPITHLPRHSPLRGLDQ